MTDKHDKTAPKGGQMRHTVTCDRCGRDTYEFEKFCHRCGFDRWSATKED